MCSMGKERQRERETERKTKRERETEKVTGGQAFSSAWVGRERERERERERQRDRERDRERIVPSKALARISLGLLREEALAFVPPSLPKNLEKMPPKAKKMKMALHELESGQTLTNGQKIIGRVFPGSEKTLAKGQTIVTKYIVTGNEFGDILLVEGWGPQAARLNKACVDGDVVEISGVLPIRR